MGKFGKHGGKRLGSGRPPVEDRKVLIQLRIKSSLTGRVSKMLYEGIATGTLPYKNPSQIYEAIIMKGIEVMDTEESDEAMQYLKATRELDESARQRREAQAAFSKARTELKEIMTGGGGKGDQEEACRVYWMLVWNFKAMNPGHWRDWFIRRMREDYPELDKSEPPSAKIIDKHNEEYDERWESKQRRKAKS